MLLIVQMLPAQAPVIPLFIDFRGIGLLDNLTGLILIYTAQALPISIWLLRTSSRPSPGSWRRRRPSMGAGPVRVFWRILFPRVAPGEILATAANRSLVLVVRDAHRSESTRDLVTSVLADRPDAVLVEMGLPVWQPPAGSCRAYVATYGASRANGQGAAEVLGLVTR